MEIVIQLITSGDLTSGDIFEKILPQVMLLLLHIITTVLIYSVNSLALGRIKITSLADHLPAGVVL